MSDCPFCPGGATPWKPNLRECVLNKPLYMVIPPEGVHLPCPAHPDGHHIHGPHVTMSVAP